MQKGTGVRVIKNFEEAQTICNKNRNAQSGNILHEKYRKALDDYQDEIFEAQCRQIFVYEQTHDSKKDRYYYNFWFIPVMTLVAICLSIFASPFWAFLLILPAVNAYCLYNNSADKTDIEIAQKKLVKTTQSLQEESYKQTPKLTTEEPQIKQEQNIKTDKPNEKQELNGYEYKRNSRQTTYESSGHQHDKCCNSIH